MPDSNIWPIGIRGCDAYSLVFAILTGQTPLRKEEFLYTEDRVAHL